MKLYRAVVEDNIDFEKLGRVRVRIYGLHTKNNENSGEFSSIQTSDLPWAEVMGGNQFGLVSGVGVSSVLHQGTWVWVFLENDNPNKPIVIGTVIGVPTEDSAGKYSGGEGFFDPDEVFPLSDRLEEPDLNEIARGEIANTVIKTKNDNLDSSAVYSEKAQVASVYPENHVVESASGHMIELDDTAGTERVQIIDKHGNYSEMKLAEYIDKAVADKVNLVMGNLIEHIAGNTDNLTDGNVTWTIGGNLTIDVTGNINITSGGTQTNANGGNYTHTAPNIFLN